MVSFFQIAIYHLIKNPEFPKDGAGIDIVNTLSTWTGIFWLEMLDNLSRRFVYLENVPVHGQAKNCNNIYILTKISGTFLPFLSFASMQLFLYLILSYFASF